jgi:hypothetical protein
MTGKVLVLGIYLAGILASLPSYYSVVILIVTAIRQSVNILPLFSLLLTWKLALRCFPGLGVGADKFQP